MGWQEREYARWTDAERRRYLGTGASRRAAAEPRFGFRQGASLAVLASAAVLVLGNLPRGHALVPALHFRLPLPHASRHVPALGKISLPRHARAGSSLTLTGRLSGADGRIIVVEGTYRDGWRVVGRSEVRGGSYSANVPLARRGLFHLRVLYPDGSRAVGSIRVR